MGRINNRYDEYILTLIFNRLFGVNNNITAIVQQSVKDVLVGVEDSEYLLYKATFGIEIWEEIVNYLNLMFCNSPKNIGYTKPPYMFCGVDITDQYREMQQSEYDRIEQSWETFLDDRTPLNQAKLIYKLLGGAMVIVSKKLLEIEEEQDKLLPLANKSGGKYEMTILTGEKADV